MAWGNSRVHVTCWSAEPLFFLYFRVGCGTRGDLSMDSWPSLAWASYLEACRDPSCVVEPAALGYANSCDSRNFFCAFCYHRLHSPGTLAITVKSASFSDVAWGVIDSRVFFSFFQWMDAFRVSSFPSSIGARTRPFWTFSRPLASWFRSFGRAGVTMVGTVIWRWSKGWRCSATASHLVLVSVICLGRATNRAEWAWR